MYESLTLRRMPLLGPRTGTEDAPDRPRCGALPCRRRGLPAGCVRRLGAALGSGRTVPDGDARRVRVAVPAVRRGAVPRLRAPSLRHDGEHDRGRRSSSSYGTDVPPWFEFFDLPHRSLAAELANYVSPRSAARHAVDEIEREVLASPRDVVHGVRRARPTASCTSTGTRTWSSSSSSSTRGSSTSVDRHQQTRGSTVADRAVLRPRLRERQDPSRRGHRTPAPRRRV